MFEPHDEPKCPRCGDAMVRRVRGSDGAPFWGCSTFPECRGTREIVTAAIVGHQPAATVGQARGRRLRFDRLVLACGAVGLMIGLGFIIVGLNSGPNTYAFMGAALVALVALVVLPSPFLPPAFARGYALRVALLCVCLAVFFIALAPVSKWLGQYFTDLFIQSIPTHAPATPSAALPGGA
jgi:CBS domain containing-hemolysin-like protein